MSDSEPKGFLGGLSRFIKREPSPEVKEQIARANAALEQAQALKAQAIADSTKHREELEARIRANSEEDTRQRMADIAAIREQRAHQPQRVDSVNDITYNPQGLPIGARLLNKYDDGYGNYVYGAYGKDAHVIGLDEVRPLLERVQTQQTAFEALSEQDRLKVQGEFDQSKGFAGNAQPYQDYLNNEALRKRFEELKSTQAGRQVK